MSRRKNNPTPAIASSFVTGLGSGLGYALARDVWSMASGRRQNPPSYLGRFVPTANPAKVGKGAVPTNWEGGGFSARLFVGLNVGRKKSWSAADVKRLVAKVRESQVGSPDSSFILQRGLYSQPGVGVVDEESVQVAIYDTGKVKRGGWRPSTKAEWKREILHLARALATALCQDEVIVDLRHLNVTFYAAGVKAKPTAECKSKLRRAANPKLVVVNPSYASGLGSSKSWKRRRYQNGKDTWRLKYANGVRAMVHRTGRKGFGAYEWWVMMGRRKIASGTASLLAQAKAHAMENAIPFAVEKRARKASRKNPVEGGDRFRGTKAEVVAWIEARQGKKLSASDRKLFEKMWRQSQTFHKTGTMEVVVGDAPKGTPRILGAAGPLLQVDYQVKNDGSWRNGEWTHKAGDRARKNTSPPAWAAWDAEGRMVVVDALGSQMRMKPTHGYVG